MAAFRPRDYQRQIIRHIITHPRCALFVPMGMGKTGSTLAALETLLTVDADLHRVLVIAPLRVAVSTWPDEVRKWGFSLSVAAICGTPAQRRAALEKGTDICTINYEQLPWLVDQLGEDWPFDVVVADESTRLKSFRLNGGSSRARALSRVAWTRVRRFVELTGTPAPNGYQDLWGQLWFLDRGQRLGLTFTRFRDMYFTPRRCGASAFAVQYDLLAWAQEKIQQNIADLCMSLNTGDYFPVDAPIVCPVMVDLPAAARRAYDRVERDAFLELDSGEVVDAVNAAARSVKCLQIAAGAVYFEPEDRPGTTAWETLHNAKIEALESIVEEAGGAPVLVAYHWQADLARLRKAFPQGRELDKDPETIRAWNRGEIPILFAHPASAGHGLNLQDGGCILAFFSLWWDLEHYQQIVERIGPVRQAQAGHPRPVYLYHILARDTLDEVVMRRIRTKRKVQDLLLEACDARKNGRALAAVSGADPVAD